MEQQKRTFFKRKSREDFKKIKFFASDNSYVFKKSDISSFYLERRQTKFKSVKLREDYSHEDYEVTPEIFVLIVIPLAFLIITPAIEFITKTLVDFIVPLS